MKHKILKRIIAVCLILSLMPVLVFATEEDEGQTIEMEIGNDLTLTGTLGVNDSNGHEWTVDNDDILQLSDGDDAWTQVVTALSAGEATVTHTYTAANGSGADDESNGNASSPDDTGIVSLSANSETVDGETENNADTVVDESEGLSSDTDELDDVTDSTDTIADEIAVLSSNTNDVNYMSEYDPEPITETWTITVTSADSTFTVQYYANIPEITATTSLSEADAYYGDYLEAINTDVTNGGKIPANDEDPTTDDVNLVYVELTEDEENSGSYEMDFAYVVSQIYKDKEYSINTKSTEYLDILSDANNYTLAEIWVWRDDCDCNITDGSERVSACTDESHWKIVDLLEVTVTEDGSTEYHTSEFPSLVSGSTTSVSDDETVITITDDTFIRFVYVTTSGTYTENATFFDYDITDGEGNTRVNGDAQGINNPANYDVDDEDAKFAFGNANTGTGLEGETWQDSSSITNAINQHNTASWANDQGASGATAYSYGGATFGLVTDELDENGNPVFSDGVVAPDLFSDYDQYSGENAVIGKTTIEGYSLEFRRDGDTYILTTVYDGSGTAVTGDLESFNHPGNYNTIWTNNFWPMDTLEDTTDGQTGASDYTGTFVSNGGAPRSYPASDDGVAHNNLFGMKYSVTFELDEDYVGDLEYFFFGDDDLWVFLTYEEEGGTTQLVCDLGGVHSSIGAYVNLWNYIDTTGDYAGTYTLSFFYTERGLSGSTCFMQFTLPEVLSIDSYEEPELDKEVYDTAATEWASENTAEIGDEVNFQTTITVGSGYTEYVLHDVLDAGFTLDATSIALDSLVEGTDYEVILDTTDGCSFEIKFSDVYLSTLESETEIVVTYSAVLNENAVIYPDANLNTTWLRYTDPSTSITHDTDEKETETYTYEDPDLDKKVKDASTGEWVVENTAAIGDIVDFQTIVTVSESCDTYVLHDVLDQGFTLVESSIAVASLSEGTTDYVVSFDTEDGCSFEIVFDNRYLNELEGDTEIVVTYSAVLNENAVIYPDANLNTTWLKYNAYYYTSDSESPVVVERETDKKITRTYTYKDPVLDKEVYDVTTGEWATENSAEIGETVDFQTTITVGAGYTEYVLHDKLDKGFDLVEESISLDSLVENTDYVVSFDTEDGCSFEIVFDNSYLNELEGDTEIVVTYSAVLNENAVVYPDANLNTTWLGYTDPSTFVTYTTDEKVTETYTYPSDVVTPNDDSTTPTTTTTSSVNTAENAQTGDDSNTSLWIALMLASGAGLTRIVLHSRKRRYGR